MSAISFWGGPQKRTVLVTGGATGIGLAISKRIAAKGHKVIITGRRAEALAKAKAETSALVTIVGDVSTEEGRVLLFDKVVADHPDLDVLINNAGVQNRLTPLTSTSVSHGSKEIWKKHKEELSTNIDGPIHLSMLFLPHLLGKPSAQIVNVSSGLAFVPIAFMPIYCATKAALHSFTLSLRHQLLSTSVSVVEIIPPAVQTDLGGAGLHSWGEPLDEYADSTVARLFESDDNIEIAYKASEGMRSAGPEQREALFKALNSAH